MPIKKLDEETASIRIYSHSPIFHWWPLWLGGFLLAGLTYMEGTIWRPDVPSRKYQAEEGPGQAELRAPDDEPDLGGAITANGESVHMSIGRALGFIYVAIFFVVLFHTGITLRGYAGLLYFIPLLILFSIVLAWDRWLPQLQGVLWDWVVVLFYKWPSVRISMNAYVFTSSMVLLVWLVSLFRDKLTYMEFSAGQVRVHHEIGEGIMIYDAGLVTFERERDDIVRHKFIGFLAGFLWPFRNRRGMSSAPKVEAVTSRESEISRKSRFKEKFERLERWCSRRTTGDLVFWIGGSHPQAIMWPNVWRCGEAVDLLKETLATRRIKQ